MNLSITKFNPKIYNYKPQENSKAFVSYPKINLTTPKDTFTRTTQVNFKGNYTTQEKDNYKSVVNSLALFNVNAEKSFDEQVASHGFFGKSVEKISNLWFSKNRSELVEKELEVYKKEVKELDASIEKNNFKNKFKEIFEVDYNQENIDKFNKANETIMLASTTAYMADTIKEKLDKDLQISKNLDGKLGNYTHKQAFPYGATGSVPYVEIKINKKDVFENMEKALTEAVGGKDALKGMLVSQNIKEDATKEDKYAAYSKIANFLVTTSQMTAKRCSKDKTIKELKKDYDETYKNAFGTKNNIQKRVDNYNRSQIIGTALLKSSVKNPLKIALLGLASFSAAPLIGVGAGVAISFGVDMFDKLTNEKDGDKDFSDDAMKQLAKETALSYVDYAVAEGMNALIPSFSTGNEILNTIISTTRKTTLDVTTSMISDYMYTGEWNNDQVAPKAFVSLVFGKISSDDPLNKQLLSLTENGVSKTLLYDKTENNSVKQFINKMQEELQKEYMKNPELYSGLKMLSMSNPEAFEKMVATLLQQHINEATKTVDNKKA